MWVGIWLLFTQVRYKMQDRYDVTFAGCLGDAVCFPPRWLHYTDSLTHSISLTLRYAP